MRSLTVVLVAGALISVAGCTGPRTPDGAAPPGRPAGSAQPGGSPGPAGSGQPDGSWRRLSPAPSPRTEVTAAASGTRIVVVGGYRADAATVATTEILDTTTGRWERGPDLPVAVNHAMAATVGDVVYVFGGYLADSKPSTAAYRLDGGAWRPTAALPEGRAAGTAVSQNGMVYVAAGVGPAGLATDMLVYDAAGDRWSRAPGPPTRREHLAGAGFGGLIYTAGGRTGGLDTNVSAVEVFDPRSRAWTALPPLPTARGGLAGAATCAGQIVVIGGEAAATFA
ncbi:MAG TPA: kelch repeat-containing protein, partial [Catenuloplanes sp.]